MFLIRSIAQANPGRRDEAVSMMKEFMAERAKAFGTDPGRVLTASIGPSDSTVMAESECKSLAEFDELLNKTNTWDRMKNYGPRFSEVMVPGSHRFEIYRIC